VSRETTTGFPSKAKPLFKRQDQEACTLPRSHPPKAFVATPQPPYF
jgi:hypothetical protein